MKEVMEFSVQIVAKILMTRSASAQSTAWITRQL